MKNTCIIIVGPTAVGKTALAIEVARHFNTEIISCDSRQCFRELNIGVAKPSEMELAAVKHHFINSHSVNDTVNAAVFEQYALKKIEEIFLKKPFAVLTGGTGLYVKAFCDGVDEIPEIDPGTREMITTNYRNYGIEWLREQLRVHDEKYFAAGEIKNPQRMMRALEVKISTGISIVDFQTKKKAYRNFNIIKIGVELPRPELIERINKRVDIMIKDGLEKEVKSLEPLQHLNALQTVGYREFFSYFKNESTFEGAVEAIKINTRQYAKRQMTWFKKDPEISWCAPGFKQVIEKLKLP